MYFKKYFRANVRYIPSNQPNIAVLFSHDFARNRTKREKKKKVRRSAYLYKKSTHRNMLIDSNVQLLIARKKPKYKKNGHFSKGSVS